MDKAFQLSADERAATPARQWLKAAEYRALLDAHSLADRARLQADELLHQARQQVHALHEQAREQGLAEGRAQAAQQMAALALRSAQVVRQLEAVIGRAVMTVLAQTLHDLPAEQLYEVALRKAARAVRGEAFLWLRVPPQQEAQAREALNVLLREGAMAGAVEVVADASLPEYACVMESEAGTVSAGLDVQLAAVGQAVSREVARLASEAMEGPDA